jgi:hypothetical protein
MLRDYVVHEGVGRPVQTPLQRKGRLQKQLIDGDAKAVGGTSGHSGQYEEELQSASTYG